MDKHDHTRHLNEGCVESVAWRTSASSVKSLLMVMVMMVHLYVALFMVIVRALPPISDALHNHVLALAVPPPHLSWPLLQGLFIHSLDILYIYLQSIFISGVILYVHSKI